MGAFRRTDQWNQGQARKTHRNESNSRPSQKVWEALCLSCDALIPYLCTVTMLAHTLYLVNPCYACRKVETRPAGQMDRRVLCAVTEAKAEKGMA
jgi:hypothetical protein